MPSDQELYIGELERLVEEYVEYIIELERRLAGWERIAERDHGKPPGEFRAVVQELMAKKIE